MNIPRIIALTGRARSGKSESARILHDRWGYVREKFSNPLKDMLRAIGMTQAMIEGDEKMTPIPWLCGKTPRHAMQTLGTEWGRDCIGKDFWVELMKQKLKLKEHRLFVIEDCRFLNEAKAIKDLGGVIIRICRDEADASGDRHISEIEMSEIEATYIVHNNGSLNDLEYELSKMLEVEVQYREAESRAIIST